MQKNQMLAAATAAPVSNLSDLPFDLRFNLLKHLDKGPYAFAAARVCHAFYECLQRPYLTSMAAMVCRVELLTWARQQGCPLMNSTCFYAARGGHLATLPWARAQGYAWNEGTCLQAAKAGHLEVLKWLRAEGCPCDERRCSFEAVRYGHIEVLRWMRGLDVGARGAFRWDAWLCAIAASEGRLDVLQWLRTQQCPWDEATCANAAYAGHLEILRWARAHGCPWNKMTCEAASEGEQLKVLQWIKNEEDCPWDEDEWAEFEEFWLDGQRLEDLDLEETLDQHISDSAWTGPSHYM